MKTLLIALLVTNVYCSNVKASMLLTTEDKIESVVALTLNETRSERSEFEARLVQDSLSSLSQKTEISYETRELLLKLKMVFPNKNKKELLATLASVLMAKNPH